MGNNSSKTPKHITEVHPNPHGEQQISEMPLQTDHRGTGSENVAQNPSTRENRLNPSVIGPLEDPTTDSMFNLADQQVRELLEENMDKDRLQHRGASVRRKKAAKNRKTP
ncbi:MAG TPA: hypothetical protein VKD65_07775 [Candidatus Angelobacter sp.]|nr:hypothetical protein [Candidatus Angelobacter sp.]